MSTTERTVRVAAIHIKNVLGIAEAEIRPGKVTMIQGRNGVGKTSLLESIRAALGGGHDVTLLRKGETKGEVMVLLEDGTEITKTITPETSKTRVKHPEYGTLPAPGGYLAKLRDTLSLNPVDFLVAKKDRRLELLLSAIPLKLQKADLANVLDLCSTKPNLDRHALEVLAGIEKDLYDQRTGMNRSLKDKRTAAEEMRKALPPEAGDGTNWKSFLEAGERELRKLEQDTLEMKHAIESNITERWNQAEMLRREHVSSLEAERDAEIARIRADYSSKIESAKQAITQVANDLRQEKEERIAALTNSASEKRISLQNDIAQLRAKADAYTRAKAAREHIQLLEDGASQLESDANLLTGALDELSTIKGDLLDRLPIKGVEIQDGDIFVDGIQFDRVNESRRVRLAIEMALLRAGSLRLLCVDGIESLDSASQQALFDFAEEKGIQLIIAKVTDGPLNVENIA